MIMEKKPKVIVLGCGGRGKGAYARYIEMHPDEAEIVAVAEPRDYYRNSTGDAHHVPEEYRFRSWEEALSRPKFADAVLICTMDDMHEGPAVKAAELGYGILLEKPIAPTAEACRRIVAAVKKAGVPFAVCHVLRYTNSTRKIKELIAGGVIGDLVSIQRLEGVGHWHQAHSFVRGNWRNEKETSFMLLQKCCHDLDWIRYIMGVPCTRVQSFGSLHHFNAAGKPAGAADRCPDCPGEVESMCPYSAIKIYLRDRVCQGTKGWPTDVVTPDMTPEGVMKALREGPYGRCVYACDNDVVDNQVVNMEFEGKRTATLTMTAFCNDGRQTRIFGTRGSIQSDAKMIRVTEFLTGKVTEYEISKLADDTINSGHGGGDGGLMNAFLTALRTGDRSLILSGTDETLESHLMVFASEESRHTGKVLEPR